MNYNIVVWTLGYRLTEKLRSVFPCQLHGDVMNGADFGHNRSWHAEGTHT